MNIRDAITRVARMEPEERRAEAIDSILPDMLSIEKVRSLYHYAVLEYRRGEQVNTELKNLLKAIDEMPADICVALARSLSSEPYVIGTNGHGVRRWRKLNGDAVEQGDIIVISQNIMTGVCDASMQRMFRKEEARVVDVYNDDGMAKVDFGPTGGSVQLITLSHALLSADLRPGANVLASSQYGMAWCLAPNGTEKAKNQQTHEHLVFAGYSEYRKWLEINIIKRLKHWKKFDRANVILVNGPTGTGKTFGIKYAAQEASAVLIMRSPGDLRSYLFSGSEHLIKDDFRRIISLGENGQSVVYLLNEADVILGARTRYIHSSVEDTLHAITSEWLAGIDRLNTMKIPAVIGFTTNYKQLCDSAILNSHRISSTYELGFPSPGDIAELVDAYVPEDATDRKTIVDRLSDYLRDDLPLICVTTERGIKRELTLRELASPAVISGICQTARDLAAIGSIDSGEDISIRYEHYEAATVQRIRELVSRLEDTRIASETMPAEIRSTLGRIVSVETIYNPDYCMV